LEIADGIYLIKNPHSTYFVSSVLITGESLTLVDAGRIESPETSIYPAIRALGRDPREISMLVLTHAHWDHSAGAAQIKTETGCKVAVHFNGEAYLTDPETVTRELTNRFPGIPSGNMAELDAVTPDETFSDGSIIHLNERELKVVHTPGHSACSCCIVEPDLGLYIAGDSIQGRGGRRPLIFHDVGDYLASMKRLLGEPIKTIVNGHPFPPAEKGVLKGEETVRHVEESVKAVEELMDTVLDSLNESDGPMSITEIHETVGVSQPFTIGCILEALEAEGKTNRETTRGKMLW
jgi:glyoxylase-like metal-dependent hydrolase (beta-lactamase superfamily II)